MTDMTELSEYTVDAVGIAQTTPLEGDPSDELLDAIEDAGGVDAVASVAPTTGVVTATFTLDAPTPAVAAERAGSLSEQAFARVGIPLVRVALADVRSAAALGELEDEVTAAEIARRIGVSRERVRQLSELPSFPSPVRQVAQSGLYRWLDVVEFLAERTRRTKSHSLVHQ